MTDYERGVTDAITVIHWHSRHYGIVHASQPDLIERDLRKFLINAKDAEDDGFITVCGL